MDQGTCKIGPSPHSEMQEINCSNQCHDLLRLLLFENKCECKDSLPIKECVFCLDCKTSAKSNDLIALIPIKQQLAAC